MKVLHAGCGPTPLPEWFPPCEEVRLDIDENVGPDVVASMTDMGAIGEFDAVFTAQALEHLYPEDVPVALGEFLRVLRPGGAAIVIVPDLTNVKPTDEVLYESPAGSVTGHDMFYGMRHLVAGNKYMAHHCGFTVDTLRKAMADAGFDRVHCDAHSSLSLMAVGFRP